MCNFLALGVFNLLTNSDLDIVKLNLLIFNLSNIFIGQFEFTRVMQ